MSSLKSYNELKPLRSFWATCIFNDKRFEFASRKRRCNLDTNLLFTLHPFELIIYTTPAQLVKFTERTNGGQINMQYAHKHKRTTSELPGFAFYNSTVPYHNSFSDINNSVLCYPVLAEGMRPWRPNGTFPSRLFIHQHISKVYKFWSRKQFLDVWFMAYHCAY